MRQKWRRLFPSISSPLYTFVYQLARDVDVSIIPSLSNAAPLTNAAARGASR